MKTGKKWRTYRRSRVDALKWRRAVREISTNCSRSLPPSTGDVPNVSNIFRFYYTMSTYLNVPISTFRKWRRLASESWLEEVRPPHHTTPHTQGRHSSRPPLPDRRVPYRSSIVQVVRISVSTCVVWSD